MLGSVHPCLIADLTASSQVGAADAAYWVPWRIWHSELKLHELALRSSQDAVLEGLASAIASESARFAIIPWHSSGPGSCCPLSPHSGHS